MLFLIGELVVYLIIAALIGFVAGWLLGRIGRHGAPPTTDAETATPDESLPHQLIDRDERVAFLEAELAPYRSDDLKLVNGIGPVFERTLNFMGYTTYEHVAAWSRDDIRDVAAEIDLFPDRIIRDQWVEQAAALAEAKVAPDHEAVAAGEPESSVDEGSD